VGRERRREAEALALKIMGADLSLKSVSGHIVIELDSPMG
jgi:hypothetical protein